MAWVRCLLDWFYTWTTPLGLFLHCMAFCTVIYSWKKWVLDVTALLWDNSSCTLQRGRWLSARHKAAEIWALCHLWVYFWLSAAPKSDYFAWIVQMKAKRIPYERGQYAYKLCSFLLSYPILSNPFALKLARHKPAAVLELYSCDRTVVCPSQYASALWSQSLSAGHGGWS